MPPENETDGILFIRVYRVEVLTSVPTERAHFNDSFIIGVGSLLLRSLVLLLSFPLWIWGISRLARYAA